MDIEMQPLLKPFRYHLSDKMIGLYPLASSDNAALYKYFYSGGRDDPGYFLATDKKLLIEFGITGMPASIYKKVGRDVEPILVREAKKVADDNSVYYLYRDNLPANGVADNPSYDNVQVAAQLMDYAFNKVREIPDFDDEPELDKFKRLNASHAVSRFNSFLKRVDSSSIIPDFSDTFAPVPSLMEGCGYKCDFCPIAGSLKLYSLDEIINEFEWARKTLDEFHTDYEINNYISDIFLNGSDLMWHAISPRGVDPRKIIELKAEYFPEIGKTGAFFGNETTVKAYEKYGHDFFVDLFTNRKSGDRNQTGDSFGINRAYKGDETGHDLASRLLGKPISYDSKVKAANILKGARIALKQIVQVGAFGEGFYLRDEDIGKARTHENFVSWQDITDKTADLIVESAPYRVLVSRHIPLSGLPIQKHIDSGRIVPYEDFEEGVTHEKQYLRSKLERAHTKGIVKWQGTDSGKKYYEPPIEDNYEDFVAGAVVRAA